MLRSEVISRTATLWPYARVPYDQSARWNGLYRQDCSGFLSGLWATPVDGPGTWGGYSTVSLVTLNIMSEIAPSALKPGDAIGICGPGTGGNDGHIMLFERWYNTNPNDNRCWIWEQAGGTYGPRRRLINYPFGSYRSYKCFKVQDDQTVWLRRPWPSYMNPSVDYFGDINGPDESHGGFFPIERPDVLAIQQRCNTLGFNCGIPDGFFGPNTVNGVTNWQRALYANITTLYGQVWADDWSRLFTY